MKKNIFSHLLLIISLNLPASAILGETQEQCAARYGPPKKVDATSATYSHVGYQIVVTFETKKAVVLIYEKEKKDAKGDPLTITDTEVAALLKSNGGTQAWVRLDRTDPEDGWRTTDKKCFAEHLFSGQLWVMTKDHASPSLTME